MRPPAPVPSISAGSRPCSAMSRRTTGERTLLGPPRLPGALGGRSLVGRVPPEPPGLPEGGRWPLDGPLGADGDAGLSSSVSASVSSSVSASVSSSVSASVSSSVSASVSGSGSVSDSASGLSAAGPRPRPCPRPPTRRHRRAPPRRSRPTWCPTSTVSPSGTRISVMNPAAGDGHLGVDLVGRDLEEDVVLGYRVADLLQPLGDRALGDRFAQLGHGDVSQRAGLFRSGPGPSRRRSPTASGGAG